MPHLNPPRKERDTMDLSPLGRSFWRAFVLSYGLLSAVIWALFALRDATIFRRRSRRVAEKELADARDRLWNLAKAPLPNFRHAFFTTSDEAPVTLHYVVSGWDAGPRPNLVVFLHGFPDSWVLWKDFLSQKRNLDPETVYMALDLPGYGGSDSLAEYNAYNVLEAVTGFVLAMRERYLPDGNDSAVGLQEDRGQVVLVSHDWGGAIASRLASEAPQLADHFVITSVVLPRLFIANAQARISSARRMCHTWMQQPLNFRPLRNSWRTLRPLLSQLNKSHYIFAFNLPPLLARVSGSFTGAWFLSKIHRIASFGVVTHGDAGAIKDAAEALASSLGPGIEQCTTHVQAPLFPVPEKQAVNDTTTPHMYPSTVHTRANSPSHSWFQKTRYYRDGLILGPWSKSLQTILSLSVLDSSNSTLVGSSTAASPTSAKFSTLSKTTDHLPSTNGNTNDDGGAARHRRRRSSAGIYASSFNTAARRRSSLSVGASLFDGSTGGPLGALRAPATLVVGAKDVAFEWRLGLEGVGDYLAKGGAVVVCEGQGHWLVREGVGMEVLRRCVGSVVGVEEGSGVIVGGQGSAVRGLVEGLDGVRVAVER